MRRGCVLPRCVYRKGEAEQGDQEGDEAEYKSPLAHDHQRYEVVQI